MSTYTGEELVTLVGLSTPSHFAATFKQHVEVTH
jgi:AraC-like DNA-binding protein